MDSRTTLYCLLLVVPVLTACGMPPLDPDDNWDKGARVGRIVGSYGPQLPSSELPDCLAALPKEELAGRRFVRVRYPHVRRSTTTIAEIPAGLDAKVGDRVEVWPQECSGGKVSRITRMLGDR